MTTFEQLKQQLLDNPIFYKKINKKDSHKYKIRITKEQYKKLKERSYDNSK